MMLEELIQKTGQTRKHTQQFRSTFALNRNSAGFNQRMKEVTYTLVCDQLYGPYAKDIDGNQYIDLTMGFGSILLGHNDERIKNAIIKQMNSSWSVGPMSPLAGPLSERIAKITKTDRVGFFNSGTEAVMVALRAAKAASKKNYFVFFKGAYHGTFDSLLTIRSHQETHIAQETVPGITQSILNESYLFEYGSPESLKFITEHAHEIAAVLVEPVQSRNPGLQPKEFLKEMRKICTAGDIALIFDEVISGFRVGIGGNQEFFGVSADIVTYGKVIGGGLPIGIVAGKSKYLDTLDGGFWEYGDDSGPKARSTFVAGTFCHHPMAMAASMEILDVLEENPQMLPKLNARNKALCDRLNAFFVENDFKFSIAYFASLFRFTTPGRHRLLYHYLLLNGVYVWEGRNCFISPAHTDEILDELEETIKKSCFQMREDGVIR